MITQIPITKIFPSDSNPRIHVDDNSVKELSESIKSVGLINPITVRPMNEHYDVVAGERRYFACKMAGLESIDCIVKELSDDDVLEIQIIENLQRIDVHPLDEANGFEKLLKSGRYTKETIGEKVGKSTAYVVKRIQLTNLIDKAQEAFFKNEFSLGHAQELARLNEAQQKQALTRLKNGNIYYPLNEFKQQIQRQFFLDLSKAVFDTKDDALLNGIPSCKNCPNRTGHNTNLFDDIENKNTCTNPKCYDNKVKAHLDNKIETYKAKNKELLKISSEWSGKNKELLYRNNFAVIGKGDKCESMQDAIVVKNPYDWANDFKVGKIMKICIDKECKIHHKFSYQKRELTPKEKREEEKQKLEREIDQKYYDALILRIADKVKLPLTNELLTDLMKIILELIDNYQELDAWVKRHDGDEIEDEENLEKTFLNVFSEYTVEEKLKTLMEIVYAFHLPHQIENVEPAIKRYKIDTKKLRAQVEKEIKGKVEKEKKENKKAAKPKE